MTEKRALTLGQMDVRSEFVEAYGIEEDQVNFEGESVNPILDYEALCVFRIAVTDFQNVTVSEPIVDKSLRFATVNCTITLADGRSVSVSEVAEKDEVVNGEKLETFRQLRSVARSRAMRSGMRTAGINILRAHRAYMEGNKTSGNPVDPRQLAYNEIHLLAQKTGFITNGDKTEYQTLIAELYEGRTSAKDLNDLELRRLLTTLRSFDRKQQSSSNSDLAA